MLLTVYLLCKHKKLRTLLASLVLHQVKEVEAATQKEINYECKILAHVSLTLTIFGTIMVAILNYLKVKTMQRTYVFQCSKNYDIYIRCSLLCTYKAMQNWRKSSICLKLQVH